MAAEKESVIGRAEQAAGMPRGEPRLKKRYRQEQEDASSGVRVQKHS